jgi:hypothetical protein
MSCHNTAVQRVQLEPNVLEEVFKDAQLREGLRRFVEQQLGSSCSLSDEVAYYHGSSRQMECYWLRCAGLTIALTDGQLFVMGNDARLVDELKTSLLDIAGQLAIVAVQERMGVQVASRFNVKSDQRLPNGVRVQRVSI